MKVAKNEEAAVYAVAVEKNADIIARAIALLHKDLSARQVFSSPAAVKQYCQLNLAALEYEVFGVLFLDVQNRLIAYEAMFRGTLTQTRVYPREVVKAALANNAAAVILAHNHPSGIAEPSRADEMLTRSLKEALAMVDVKVLDHFIVAGNTPPLSFAERGLL